MRARSSVCSSGSSLRQRNVATELYAPLVHELSQCTVGIERSPLNRGEMPANKPLQRTGSSSYARCSRR